MLGERVDVEESASNAARADATGRPTLLTVGHGTLAADRFARLLGDAGVETVVDVRTAPGSRRHPQFSRAELGRWLPPCGIGYRWEPRLGGFRRPGRDSPHVALRHPSFRGYADYMETDDFAAGMARLVAEARQTLVAVMCSESLWWRCHRRLVADAAVLLEGFEVLHLGHDGRLLPHRLTDGVRRDDRRLVYDAGQARLDA